MPAWPRDVLPQKVSAPLFPGSLLSWGQTGVPQARATEQVGRIWTETMPPMKADAVNTRKLIAIANQYWREGTSFTIEHRAYLTNNGALGGTPLVNGGSQTGANLATDGWPNNTLVLNAGDIFTVAGSTLVYDVTADVTSNGTGQATIPISPPIFAGGSPANDAALTVTSVVFTCKLAREPNFPASGPDDFLAGVSFVFREVGT